jgi:hypothetical protein
MGKPIKRPLDTETRYRYVLLVAQRVMKHVDAVRAEQTRKLVSFDFLRGDLHTHSSYSDGRGEVAESVETMKARGLDFLFITDHGTVRQKVECRPHRNVWWGQEPGAGPQHVCLLDNPRKFRPVGRIGEDAARLRETGCFFFYPHPTGWFPSTNYAPEKIAALDEAGDRFAIEVLNAYGRHEPFYDKWTAETEALWDRFLGEGRRVIGLGASDAHGPLSVGVVWTGVLGARLNKRAVLNSLRAGNAFASSGPALRLCSGDTPMGGELRLRGATLKVDLECADSQGLNWIKVVAQGRTLRRVELRGAKHFREALSLRLPAGARYLRAECAAIDDRRAYGNPLYLLH